MKKRYSIITILLLLSILHLPFVADAVEPFTVRVIYFQPIDAPPVPDHLADLMEEVQEFYAHEMERHDYGFKTFRFERDENDKIVIHTINGKHDTLHYTAPKTSLKVQEELPFEFSDKNVNSHDTIQIVIVGGLDLINNSVWGVGWPLLGWRTGGRAYIAGNILNLSLAAHELGHAFGLYHTDVANALMGPGSDVLLDYETRWLDKHHYFNDLHTRKDIPEFVADLGAVVPDRFVIRYRIAARSKSGLYHSQMCKSDGVFVLGSDKIDGNSDVIEIDVPRRLLTKGDRVWYQIMDVNGNCTLEYVDNVEIPPNNPARDPNVIVNKNPEPNQPDEEIDKDIDPCPHCMPNDDEVREKINLALQTQNKLTTSWAIIKTRR